MDYYIQKCFKRERWKQIRNNRENSHKRHKNNFYGIISREISFIVRVKGA